MFDIIQNITKEAYIAGLSQGMNPLPNKHWTYTWEELRKKYKI